MFTIKQYNHIPSTIVIVHNHHPFIALKFISCESVSHLYIFSVIAQLSFHPMHTDTHTHFHRDSFHRLFYRLATRLTSHVKTIVRCIFDLDVLRVYAWINATKKLFQLAWMVIELQHYDKNVAKYSFAARRVQSPHSLNYFVDFCSVHIAHIIKVISVCKLLLPKHIIESTAQMAIESAAAATTTTSPNKLITISNFMS